MIIIVCGLHGMLASKSCSLQNTAFSYRLSFGRTKVMVKLSLYLTKYHAMNTYGGMDI